MRKWFGVLPVLLIAALAVAASTRDTTASTPHAEAETSAPAASPAPPTTTTARLLADDSHATAASAGKIVSTGALPAADLHVAPVGSGAGLTAAVDPGATAKTTFVVSNRSPDLRFTVHLAAVDATARAGGRVEYASAASTGKPASWLTLSDVVATIEPGGKVQVSVTVAPTANAQPGNDLAGIVVRVDHAEHAADGRTVDGSLSVTLPVSIDVKGAATALVSIEQVRAVKDGSTRRPGDHLPERRRDRQHDGRARRASRARARTAPRSGRRSNR